MPTQQQDTLPIAVRVQQYHALGVTVARRIAITTLVFQRDGLGYRNLSPGAVGVTTVFLCVLQAIGNAHVSVPLLGSFGATHPSESLRNFAIASGTLCWVQRRKALRSLREGKRAHTRSLGISPFESLPIRTDLIYRFIDPAVTVLAGLCIHKFGFAGLGSWVVLSGLSLHIVEQFRWGRQMEADLDTLDSEIESDVVAETAAHFAADGKSQSLRATGGLPSGIDDELQRVIARRKAGVK